MKFISIRDGISIRKEEICCVERTSITTCRVSTENASYECDYSYGSILMLLEQDSIEESMSKNFNVARETSNNLYGNQHFAG